MHLQRVHVVDHRCVVVLLCRAFHHLLVMTTAELVATVLQELTKWLLEEHEPGKLGYWCVVTDTGKVLRKQVVIVDHATRWKTETSIGKSLDSLKDMQQYAIGHCTIGPTRCSVETHSVARYNTGGTDG